MDHENPHTPHRPEPVRRDRRPLTAWVATTTAAAVIAELVNRLLDHFLP